LDALDCANAEHGNLKVEVMPPPNITLVIFRLDAQKSLLIYI